MQHSTDPHNARTTESMTAAPPSPTGTPFPPEQALAPSGSLFVRGTIIVVLIVLMGGALMIALIKSRKKPARKRPKVMSLKVQVKEARAGAKFLYLEGYGTARADKRIEVVPELAGKVTRVSPSFKPGGIVRKGELLFSIDARTTRLDIRRLKAQLASLGQQISLSTRALDLARRDLARNRRLFRKKALSRGVLESVNQRVLDRAQRLESLRQAHQIAQIHLETAKIILSRTRVRAPFAAKIRQGGLDRGAFVNAGRPVAVLESVNSVDIPVAFPLSSLASITGDSGTPVSLDKLPTSLRRLPPVQIFQPQMTSHIWKGRVIRVGAGLDLKTRTIDLWVRVPLSTTSTAPLLPGMFCRVRIPVRRLKGIFSLPVQAVYDRHIYTAAKGKLKRIQIDIVHRESEFVLFQGLPEGTLMVLNPLSDPVEGMDVIYNKPSSDTTGTQNP